MSNKIQNIETEFIEIDCGKQYIMLPINLTETLCKLGLHEIEKDCFGVINANYNSLSKCKGMHIPYKITYEELAQKIGTAKRSVGEAIRQLINKGVIIHITGKGYIVNNQLLNQIAKDKITLSRRRKPKTVKEKSTTEDIPVDTQSRRKHTNTPKKRHSNVTKEA